MMFDAKNAYFKEGSYGHLYLVDNLMGQSYRIYGHREFDQINLKDIELGFLEDVDRTFPLKSGTSKFNISKRLGRFTDLEFSSDVLSLIKGNFIVRLDFKDNGDQLYWYAWNESPRQKNVEYISCFKNYIEVNDEMACNTFYRPSGRILALSKIPGFNIRIGNSGYSGYCYFSHVNHNDDIVSLTYDFGTGKMTRNDSFPYTNPWDEITAHLKNN